MSYLPIAQHGVIGDLRTAALVGVDGCIDWMCWPNFDSPSLFAALLDDQRGGLFRISAASADATRRQMYLPDSNILVTRFLTPDGVAEVVDFMPVFEEGADAGREQRLIRLVRGVRGALRFSLECRPVFGYGCRPARASRSDRGFRLSSGSDSVTLSTPLDLREGDGSVSSEFEVREGDRVPLVLHGDGASGSASSALLDRCGEDFQDTLRYWQSWVSRMRYHGRWREMVARASLVLKMLTYGPTGAIVASPTTSLPERLHGDRNWDYRYTWIRDAAFTVYAFLRVGFTEEAERFIAFLEEHCRVDQGLQVLYGVDGRREIPERTLEHLAGYEGSSPVRIGNAAAAQFQLDITGDLVDAIYLYDKYCKPLSYRLWNTVRGLADRVCEDWQKEDEGIWEVRGGAQQFTFSKMMCWVALDRALRLASKESLPADVPRWRAARDAIYETVMSRGFSEKRNSFVQRLDGSALDASMLMAPLVKFISPSDPRMLGTLDAIAARLESDHLVRRYDPRVAPDGIGEEEGTFSACTFWLAEALARSGSLVQARLIFEKMLGYANHLGLYSEEIGLTGELLGNFPQAFTHLGLISAAVNIDRALDSEAGHSGRGPVAWN
ncbi:MAG TPA: glycoside hydrolase family 15 protein [Thermoanaerobaculia bacterium]|nr:glycoside hydrolase family 15 protein [Thermoanaerobaculia bacterium]